MRLHQTTYHVDFNLSTCPGNETLKYFKKDLSPKVCKGN